MLRIRILDPGPGAFLTPVPGIRNPGWVESQHPDPGSGMNNLDQLKNHFFGFLGVKILKFVDADPGSGMESVRIQDPGSGMEKSRIRDPG